MIDNKSPLIPVPSEVEGPSAPISARDVIETAVALTAAALFGALIAIIEGWL